MLVRNTNGVICVPIGVGLFAVALRTFKIRSVFFAQRVQLFDRRVVFLGADIKPGGIDDFARFVRKTG